MKTKVLEVCYGFGYGGIRAFIMNTLEYIDRSKTQVDIYAFGTSDSPFKDKVKSFGANIYFQPENNVRNIKRFVNQLETFMNEHGPYDVVHANCNLISAWVLLAAKRAGVPVRLSHSHTSSHFDGSLIQKIYSYFRRFLIGRLATEKLACGQLAGETMYGKNAKFTIINNGINVDRFLKPNIQKVEELKEQLKIPKGAKVYANVTRFDSSKNLEFAVDVFREIHKIESNSILILGGGDPSISSTKQFVIKKIHEYGLSDSVRLTGPIMGVENLYHLSDLWIYCSSYEGLPFGPIELQAAGVPCLASDVITKEIDLGLGLVDFLSLNDSVKLWAEKAVSTKKRPVDSKDIKTAFKKYNYDIRESVLLLEKEFRINRKE